MIKRMHDIIMPMKMLDHLKGEQKQLGYLAAVQSTVTVFNHKPVR